jgi:hypothetical protein
MKLAQISVLSLAALLAASTAFAGNKGANLFAIQLTNGTADLYERYDSDFISAFDHSELGVQLQGWHFLSNDYAVTLSLGTGFFSETDKPGNAAAPGTTRFKYSQSSWNVRLGGDRVFALSERGLIYLGPGVEFWSGKAKFEGGSGQFPNYQTGNVTRIGVEGRLGGIEKLTDSVSLTGHIGHRVGMASATDAGRKATWWPSSFDGAAGLVFGFGK